MSSKPSGNEWLVCDACRKVCRRFVGFEGFQYFYIRSNNPMCFWGITLSYGGGQCGLVLQFVRRVGSRLPSVTRYEFDNKSDPNPSHSLE